MITWNTPTLYSDGSSLNSSDLNSYRIYYGTNSAQLDSMIDLGTTASPKSTSYTVSGLTANQRYYFRITAYNMAGTESEYSQEINLYIY